MVEPSPGHERKEQPAGVLRGLFRGIRERAAPSMEANVVAIASGKGGTGKSFVATSLAVLLSLHGQEVRTAFGGLEALRVAEEWQPDAAVLDIGMQDMNGYELCRRLRAQSWGRQLLLIACTGWGQDSDREQARSAGFDHHLVKPVDPEAMLRLLSAPAPHR